MKINNLKKSQKTNSIRSISPNIKKTIFEWIQKINKWVNILLFYKICK
jgi:hypothetical protein